MELDAWRHATTGVKSNSNVFGTPRSWIARAYDQKFFSDSASMASKTTIDHREVTFGAIFPRGVKLPDFGNEKAIYRYFLIPKGYTGNGGGRRLDYHDARQVIGVVLTVKPEKWMALQKLCREHGVEWMYFCMPQEIPKCCIIDTSNQPRQNTVLDHNVVYEMLSRGMGVTEIANNLGVIQPTISYIKRKWLAGKPAKLIKRKHITLDKQAILLRLREGIPVKQVAEEFDTTRETVYQIRKKYML